jgi:hypothetical protein
MKSVFPQQQLLRESASVLLYTYIACLVIKKYSFRFLWYKLINTCPPLIKDKEFWHSENIKSSIIYRVNKNGSHYDCPCARHEGIWVSVCMCSSLILNDDTRWRRLVSFMIRLLYAQGKGKSPNWKQSLAGTQSLSGRFPAEKNILLLPEIEPRLFVRSAHSVVTIPGNYRVNNVFKFWLVRAACSIPVNVC